jgi:transcriptional regulator with XRE-family HTH domain
MIFSEKLLVLRKSKGLTQEELAEKLSVSRQAIAKWESGQAYPDISNLIGISEFFKVAIDHLVKDHDSCHTALVHETSCDQSELTDFLVNAKCRTYAAKGAEVMPSRPGSHDLRYEDGDFLYLDTYLGGECFSGEEAVWKKGVPIYGMNYCGRTTDGRFNGDFLKAALLAVPKDKPFRGPAFYQENDYLYSCKVCGDLEWFQGHEEIFYKNFLVYECYFHGGKII